MQKKNGEMNVGASSQGLKNVLNRTLGVGMVNGQHF